MRRGRPQRGIKGQVAYLVAFGQSGLDVTTALAVRLGSGAPAGLLSRQPVELSVQPPRGKFLGTADLLAAFPPIGVVRRLRNGLRPGLLLRDFRAIRDLIFLA